jgi:hypothetical protein
MGRKSRFSLFWQFNESISPVESSRGLILCIYDNTSRCDLLARIKAAVLLHDGLHASRALFDALRAELSNLELPQDLTTPSASPTKTQFQVPELTFFQGLVSGSKAKNELLTRNADVNFREAVQLHQRAESTRKEKSKHSGKPTKRKSMPCEKRSMPSKPIYKKGDPHGIVEYYSLIFPTVFLNSAALRSFRNPGSSWWSISYLRQRSCLQSPNTSMSKQRMPSRRKRPTLPTLRISIVTLWQPSP